MLEVFIILFKIKIQRKINYLKFGLFYYAIIPKYDAI
jgi:hypothetical protein